MVTHAISFWAPVPKLKKYYYMDRMIKFKTLCQARIFEGPEYGLNEGHEIDCPHCMQSWDGIEDAIERQFK